MAATTTAPALVVERTCALVAVALSRGRRRGARLVSGERRTFGMNDGRTVIEVPYPALASDWTRRTLTCGVALQCAPSKDLLNGYALHELTPRELRALALVEGRAALGWVSEQWPGLLPELRRHLGDLDPIGEDLDGAAMLERAMGLARSREPLGRYPLLGRLTPSASRGLGLSARALRMRGRMPWSSKKAFTRIGYSIPVAGEGGVRNPNLPPPSRPEDEEIEIRTDQRVGVPYPEWNAWTQSFLPRHVAVLESKHPLRSTTSRPVAPGVRRWFEEHTHRVMTNGLEDGSCVDIDRYVDYHIDRICGHTPEPRVFRDLLPEFRDVTTALLLDGSSSLGVHQGRIFRLELACADALSRAMRLARERHGVFVFSGNTRHRVDVRCLKDFDEPHFAVPSGAGLATGGYTRLGAPLRHLTSRLLGQPSERRMLIVIGDGLMSDEGYEGRYAWADVAHAVEEAEEAGVAIYYIGLGPTRVDPLPEVFGPRRSTRIRHVDELPNVLAHVHRELVAT
ncbi:MorD protein [Mycobacterium alsense]|uniref:MorD protein n=1 Tax=Mycobacterium alsense TaxID=324058 RepID=A0ABD6P5B8_9MYCO|nr:VWA domain-containing protein [Mycobacterium alsense]OBG40943.1 MorD protein [Mycobacterium alsense]